VFLFLWLLNRNYRTQVLCLGNCKRPASRYESSVEMLYSWKEISSLLIHCIVKKCKMLFRHVATRRFMCEKDLVNFSSSPDSVFQTKPLIQVILRENLMLHGLSRLVPRVTDIYKRLWILVVARDRCTNKANSRRLRWWGHLL